MGETGNIREPSDIEKLTPAFVEDDEVLALRSIVEGTATGTGEAFFRSLVRHLATATDTHYAFVAEFLGGERVRTLAYWAGGQIAPNVEWDLPGTPCEEVIRGTMCHHASGVKDKFPLDRPLVEMAIESYLGVPLRDVGGVVLGHLAVFDERPMPAAPHKLATFQIFAARAAAELQRLHAEK